MFDNWLSQLTVGVLTACTAVIVLFPETALQWKQYFIQLAASRTKTNPTATALSRQPGPPKSVLKKRNHQQQHSHPQPSVLFESHSNGQVKTTQYYYQRHETPSAKHTTYMHTSVTPPDKLLSASPAGAHHTPENIENTTPNIGTALVGAKANNAHPSKASVTTTTTPQSARRRRPTYNNHSNQQHRPLSQLEHSPSRHQIRSVAVQLSTQWRQTQQLQRKRKPDGSNCEEEAKRTPRRRPRLMSMGTPHRNGSSLSSSSSSLVLSTASHRSNPYHEQKEMYRKRRQAVILESLNKPPKVAKTLSTATDSSSTGSVAIPPAAPGKKVSFQFGQSPASTGGAVDPANGSAPAAPSASGFQFGGSTAAGTDSKSSVAAAPVLSTSSGTNNETSKATEVSSTPAGPTTQASGVFSFGSTTANSDAAPVSSKSSADTGSATGATPGLSLGSTSVAPVSSAPVMTSSATATPATIVSSSNGITTAPQPAFAFGSTSATTPAAGTIVNPTVASSNSNVTTTSAPQPAFAFGSSSNTTPAAGTIVNPSSTTATGAAIGPNPATSFGASAPSNPSASTAFAFGSTPDASKASGAAPATAAPAFAFGSTTPANNSKTPATSFGGSAGAPSAFGSTQPATAGGTFGTGAVANNFGAQPAPAAALNAPFIPTGGFGDTTGVAFASGNVRRRASRRSAGRRR